jgi:hypothetical protein
MVTEPFVRMGPPPQSLAAEANDCFMVRPDRGLTEYKDAARVFACNGGFPSVRFLPCALTPQIDIYAHPYNRPTSQRGCDDNVRLTKKPAQGPASR